MISLDRAEEFIRLNARLLDRLRFDFHFRGGDPLRVVAALSAYQNADGGFGHALEPDLRGPESQPVPRTTRPASSARRRRSSAHCITITSTTLGCAARPSSAGPASTG